MERDSDSSMVENGTTLGAYRLLVAIGQGGMGEVWLAEHTLLGRRAAIKLLRPSFSKNPEMVTRFFNEARAATAISDPGIVQIFDFGYHVDGSAYIVMELLEGEALDKRLRRVGVMAIEDALRVIRQVASSLGAAHARSIIHRDLKPENLFLVRDPEVPGGERAKILDFGIAKLVDDPFALKTQTSALIGTPMYMSPEQCRGAGHVDQRTDVYSLGCVLYTLIVGRPVFQAAGTGEMIAMHLCAPPPVPSQHRAGVPRSVDDLIMRCIAKDPNHRFRDGSELAAAIGMLIARESAPAIAAPRRSGRITAETKLEGSASIPQILSLRANTTLSSSAMSMVETPAPRSRSAKVIGGVAAVALVGGFGGWLALRSDPPAAQLAHAPANVEVPRTIETLADRAKRQIAATLDAFVRWAPNHPHDACPNHGELAPLVDGGVVDPWGHELVVTCTDQPADQIVGVISPGPDGMLETTDDVPSWSLGADVTSVVRGERWKPVQLPAAVHPPRHEPVRVSKPAVVPAPKIVAAPAPKIVAPPPKIVPPPPKIAAPVPVEPTPPAQPVHHGPTFRGTTVGSDGIPTVR